MNRFKKLLASFIAVLSLIAINPVSANAEWKSNTTGWWYTEGNSWATGWRNINGNWYYFYSDGYMAHDCWIGNYYLNSSGAWTTDVPSSTTTSNSTVQGTSSTNVTSDTVYVSSKGIYHKTANAHGMKNSKAMSRQEAIDSGYIACEAKHCP
ncbi:cell wall-binding protein [uncultured Clostridium sp.]|uniref:cell wall-binding protein n=1 Tax=uncultured Clostridium sp. TaxID=59620 RepID=UPI002600490C|nr:cell wall-binding protein [uncultured Clostridium sp.]